MANRSLFSIFRKALPSATARNEAGGRAYALAPKHALAQLAATGCFEQTFYAKAETQLTQLQQLIDTVDDNTFLAKLAVFSRERAFMKDMPAALVASLASRDSELMHRVFDRAIDNGRVLRTLFQMIRSGRFGRKSLSSSLQRAFGRWLNKASVSKLLAASIGRDPTLRDVLRLARPTPINNERRALFGYLTEKAVEKWTPACENDLPAQVRGLIAYRKAESAEEQVEILSKISVRWDLLADAARGPLVWKAIARQMGPQALRMNLNTLVRHDVFENDKRMVDEVARRIADVDEIKRSRQFPYQFLAAYLNASPDLSHKIKAALHQAAEVACGNVPRLSGPIVIGLDTSGSMQQPVMGRRSIGHQSPMRCIDVASLFAAAILRRNPDSLLIPFDTQAYDVRVDPQDTILSLAERFAQYGGGGTDCSLPLAMVNSSRHKQRFAGCVLVSDNMSWVRRKDSQFAEFFGAMATKAMEEWNRFVHQQRRFQRKHFRAPKLICIDIQPYGTTQAPEQDDILNIGGFSDAVFNVVSDFFDDKPNRLVTEVESIEL